MRAREPGPQIAELRLAGRGERHAADVGAAALLEERDRHVEVDVEPVPQRDPPVEVGVELARDDAPHARAADLAAQDERVVRVVGEQHDVRREAARDEGRLDAEHAVAGRRRVEAIERDALLRRGAGGDAAEGDAERGGEQVRGQSMRSHGS